MILGKTVTLNLSLHSSLKDGNVPQRGAGVWNVNVKSTLYIVEVYYWKQKGNNPVYLWSITFDERPDEQNGTEHHETATQIHGGSVQLGGAEDDA